MKWLLEKDTLDAIAGPDGHRRPTLEEERTHASDRALALDGELPQIMSVASDTARVNITGVLTDAPNLMAKWFGGGNTTYAEIRQALVISEQDPNIKTVEYFIDSGGGQASAEWVDTMDAMAAGSKPSRVIVGSMAASAAYGLASQADEILAKNRLSVVGSVGIVQTHRVNADLVDVTSSNAPDKRPDVSTEEGRATVKAELDPIEKIFMEAIATGRGTDIKDVKANYGRGGIVLAGEATTRGMIDGIVGSDAQQTKTPAPGGNKNGAIKMDLNKLKAEHPAVYAEAVAIGASQELDRVNAHLIMGNASGDMETAIKAVEDGSQMTATIQAKYMAAGMAKRDVEASEGDDADTSAALDNVDGDEKILSEEDQVQAAALKQMEG